MIALEPDFIDHSGRHGYGGNACRSDQGVDLASVTGSGVDGTITLEDVKRAASPGEGSSIGERLRGPRRAMALAMQKAGEEVVPATLTSSADVTGWSDDHDVTVQLISALVAGAASHSMHGFILPV